MTDLDTAEEEDYDCPSCNRSFDSYPGLCSHHGQAHGEGLGPEIECEECGDTFRVARSRKDTAKYCSKECMDAYDEVECKQCGCVFEAYPSRDRKFCSQECSHAWHTGENHPNRKEHIEQDCPACGETLELVPWVANSRERSFCDTECRAEWMSEWVEGRYTGEDHWMHGIDPEEHPMWEGGKATYGRGWNEEKRESVRERDGYECATCGMDIEEHYAEYDMALHVHHIVPAREFDDPEPRNDMDNLVTLCLPCHMKYEGVPLDVDT